MDSPLDRIAFPARSENRMRVLRTVTAEPRTRHELREELVVSRTTLGRVLNEFEERSLIRPTERGYATTVVADAILEQFGRFRALRGAFDGYAPRISHAERRVVCYRTSGRGPLVDLRSTGRSDEIERDVFRRRGRRRSGSPSRSAPTYGVGTHTAEGSIPSIASTPIRNDVTTMLAAGGSRWVSAWA
jgi:hypothetical protein